ncbi:MAG: signal transduction histidine kinase [Candidatus Krumholzibacteriia bacterium]
MNTHFVDWLSRQEHSIIPNMKNRRIGIPRLFIVLSLALAGLMILQVLLLKYAWDLKEQAFTRGVQSAVAATVLSLESREIEGSAYEFIFDTSATTGHSVTAAAPRRTRTKTWQTRRFRNQENSGTENHDLHFSAPDSIVIIVDGGSASGHREYIVQPTEPMDLRRVVGNWIAREPAPIHERVDLSEMREVLVDELLNLGIDVEPGFGVVRPEKAGIADFVSARGRNRFPAAPVGNGEPEVLLASDNITEADLIASPFKAQLFPLDPFASNLDLVVAFPESRMFLVWQIWPLWLASIFFITVIIFSFVKAWRTNGEQRRFADQLVDFINNMTHEFKTPISTVSLAGEALLREDVQGQPQTLARYTGMIIDENKRMHRQVDKILQMARFERGDVEFKKEPVALEGLLESVVASFSLQIEKEGGQLTCELATSEHLVWGDRVHLESIFSNLVDNAMKYSPESPQLKVSSSLVDEYLIVKVSDRGMGISRENQRRVFEKYYRCPTGNRHDVKGYGLGLSFVNSLVSAHDGYVELHSLLGQGTTVTVSLPCYELPPLEIEEESR